MTASKSMPSPIASPPGGVDAKILQQSELVDRLATEMRVASGGELPHAFCVAQVKRQLEGKSSEKSAANDKSASPPKAAAATGDGSVFHAWAHRD
jgi:hypothetical protein